MSVWELARKRLASDELYERLLKKGRRAGRGDPLVETVKKMRPDLKPILDSVPIYVLPKGEIKRLTGVNLGGVHYWCFNPKEGGRSVHSLDIFVEEGEGSISTLTHEACHAAVLRSHPDIFPFLSYETDERLATLCAEGKLLLEKGIRVDAQVEGELGELVLREGVREAFKEAVWRLGQEKCEVADEESKKALNRAIDMVMEKALEIDVLDYADREELKTAAENAKKLCIHEKL